jgi:transcriptional regulator with XRE-family HTH domain
VTKEELSLFIGNNIRKYRLEHHLTQDQLAEKIGISTSFCANLERGKKSMSIMTLRDIADALEIRVDCLLYEKNTETRTMNIEALLNGKPESFIISIEKMIRVCISEFLKDTEKDK